jgi:hypothetical protein
LSQNKPKKKKYKAMSSTIYNEAFKLLQQGEQAPPVLITDAHILGLPEPAQRYLRYAQVVGRDRKGI